MCGDGRWRCRYDNPDPRAPGDPVPWFAALLPMIDAPAPVMARIDAPIAQLLIPCPHCAGSFAPGSMHACSVRGQVVRMPAILT